MTTIGEMFLFSFSWIKDRPSFSIKLHNLKKLKALRKDGKAYSSSQLEYFLHHIDDENVAKNAYEFRKKLFNIKNCNEYFFHNSYMSEEDYRKVLDHFERIDEKTKVNHLNAMQRDDVLEKIRKSNLRTGKVRGEKISRLWLQEETRKKYIDAINDENSKKRRIENFKKNVENNKESYLKAMRSPDRVKRISESSKRMWAERDSTLKKRLTPKPGGRRFTVSGVKMNKPESIIAKFLESIHVSWEYEFPVRINEKTYYPDFYVKDKNIVIEVYGDFWHANQEKYSDCDFIYEDVTALDIRKKDYLREGEIKKVLSCEIIILWESDILTKREIAFEKIRSVLCL